MKITNEDIGDKVKNNLASIAFNKPYLNETVGITLNYIELLEEENKKMIEIKYLASVLINRSMEQFSIGEFRYKVNNFNDDYILKSELKNDLKHMKNAKATGVKQLLMKKGIIGYLEKLLS